MTAAFLAALGLSLALRLWLSRRQVKHVLSHRGAVPAAFADRIPLDVHQKAADYTLAKQRFSRLWLFGRTGVLLLWTLGGGIAWLANSLSGAWLLLGAFAITEIVLLPFTLYSTFSIEERFGFNRTTAKLFVADLVKSLVLGVAVGWPLLTGALWLMANGGSLWWVWVWAGWMGFALFFTWVYPAFIAPWFNKFRPVEDGPLRERIEALLERTGFSSEGLFVMDGSRRSAHANAYFTGWGSKKRVVLYDTLCDMLEPIEIEAVLAHEIGHCKHKHIWKRIAASAATSLAGVFVLSRLIGATWFYSGLGVGSASHAAGLLLFMWVSPVFTFPLNPLWSAWSRKHEYEADAYAIGQAPASALAASLVKMYAKNASTLTPDPIHSAYYDSHPPASLRIARIEG